MVQMHAGDINHLSVIGRNTICVLRGMNGVFTRPRKYPRCQVAKKEAVITVPSTLHRGIATRTRLGTLVEKTTTISSSHSARTGE